MKVNLLLENINARCRSSISDVTESQVLLMCREHLNELEHQVVVCKYTLGLTSAEAAKRLCTAKSRVDNAYITALEKLGKLLQEVEDGSRV